MYGVKRKLFLPKITFRSVQKKKIFLAITERIIAGWSPEIIGSDELPAPI